MQHSSSTKIRKMVSVAFLSALSVILMQFSTPIPGLPPFLKIDISSVPVMIGSFMYGPLSGVAMAAIKAAMDYFFGSYSGGVGQIADFIITSSFAITAGVIYRYNRTRKGAIIASVASIFVITIVGALTNLFILLPAYALVIPLEKIFEMSHAMNPAITDARTYILFGVVPFNFIKGTVVAVITLLVYKRISVFIHKYTEKPAKKDGGKPAHPQV